MAKRSLIYQVTSKAHTGVVGMIKVCAVSREWDVLVAF